MSLSTRIANYDILGRLYRTYENTIAEKRKVGGKLENIPGYCWIHFGIVSEDKDWDDFIWIRSSSDKMD